MIEKILDQAKPELGLILYGGMLNGVWEFLHSPLYMDHDSGWFYVLWTRVHCTVGDVLILLFTFWGTSLLFGYRGWIERFEFRPMTVFTISGLSYTIYSEWYNVYVRKSWSYTDSMPEVFGIGLTPIFQWIVIPPLVGVIIWYLFGQNKREVEVR